MSIQHTTALFSDEEQAILATDPKCLSLLALWHEIRAGRSADFQEEARHENRADHLRRCAAEIKQSGKAKVTAAS